MSRRNRNSVNITGSAAKNVDPLRWPNVFWAVFHMLAYSYDVRGLNDLDTLREFFQFFGKTLLCDTCRNHFSALLKKNPLREGEGVFVWSVDRHNDVNKRLKKTLFTIEEALRYQEQRGWDHALAEEYLAQLDRGVRNQEIRHSDVDRTLMAFAQLRP